MFVTRRKSPLEKDIQDELIRVLLQTHQFIYQQKLLASIVMLPPFFKKLYEKRAARLGKETAELISSLTGRTTREKKIIRLEKKYSLHEPILRNGHSYKIGSFPCF